MNHRKCTCGHIACVCGIIEQHHERCKFRRAAAGSVAIECDHGYDVCPICDPCTCGAEYDAEPRPGVGKYQPDIVYQHPVQDVATGGLL